MLEERIEQWKRDYINQGLEQARAKVRDDIVHRLIDALQRRFGTVPPSLGAYLATVSDEDVLFRLYERAILTDSLQEFVDQHLYRTLIPDGRKGTQLEDILLC